MKYGKIKETGEVVEVRMNLEDSLVVRFQNGKSMKVNRNAVEEIHLQEDLNEEVTTTG